MDDKELRVIFKTLFGREARGGASAPGRVNLIGEHTDYNDGFVLPIAIERRTTALFAPRPDRFLRLASVQAQEQSLVDLGSPIAPGEPAWANYCRGVAAGLADRGLKLAGADVLFGSDVPVGGGLSSSAALEVATAMALLAASGAQGSVPRRELALLCQKAEHDFAGAPCGIMDQSIVIMARPGCALLLDCRDGLARHIPFDRPDTVLLVADTRVKHDLADGGYASRREQCFQAARKLGLAALRDADEAKVNAAAQSGLLAGKELMRARHVVGEIRRTLAAASALERGGHELFGRLMYESHASLRDDFEVSCAELDAVVELASKCEGVHGARMTGGGFGGCAIILADAARAGEVERSVADGFAKRFGHPCRIFATRAAGGAQDF